MGPHATPVCVGVSDRARPRYPFPHMLDLVQIILFRGLLRRGGLAGSAVLNAKTPLVISRNFKPGFRIRLHQKDLRNALQAAESMKVSLPLTSAIQQTLIALMNQGKSDLDHSAIVTFVEEMASIQIAQPAG